MVKVVFTDIDGTLLKGFITVDFVSYLYKNNLFDKNAYEKQLQLMTDYKNGSIGFVPWLKEWAIIWGAGIKGKKQSEILEAANIFFIFFKNKIFPSSKKLMNIFHKKGYLVVGVSVGVMETAELVKEYLGLDYIIASQAEIKNGFYTGKIITNLHTSDGKKLVIEEFCNLVRVDLNESISIGDTMHDLQLFNIVKKKVALNPNKELLKYAKQHNFLVCTHSNILKKINELF
jgi:HAD superfamily phosphoserine phosphatase-like hydrolase